MVRTKFRKTFSAVCPSFSYMAIKKQGSIIAIMTKTAALLPIAPFVMKYVGTPMTAADAKQTICRFVRLNATFVFTLDKSFGTGTNAI